MLAAILNFAVLLVGERSEHAQHAEDELGDEVRRPADGHEPLVHDSLMSSLRSAASMTTRSRPVLVLQFLRPLLMVPSGDSNLRCAASSTVMFALKKAMQTSGGFSQRLMGLPSRSWTQEPCDLLHDCRYVLPGHLGSRRRRSRGRSRRLHAGHAGWIDWAFDKREGSFLDFNIKVYIHYSTAQTGVCAVSYEAYYGTLHPELRRSERTKNAKGP